MILISATAGAQTVSTVAGIAGVVGSANGPAATSSFNNPHGVASDKQGNVYVADRYGHKIRKITPAGVVSTIAGSSSPGFTNGPGVSASFNEPWAVACDTAGNIYVADAKNYAIRMITPGGVVSTVAGTGTFGVTNGPVSTAQFGFPSGLAVSPNGLTIYVCDRMTHTIRKISGGNVTTLAGTAFSAGSADGTGALARFDHPYSIALSVQGNILVADEWNNKIRHVTPAGVVTTYAGSGIPGSTNGPAPTASFNGPWGITVASNGEVYVSEGNNFLIRLITTSGNVTTYAGQDGVPGFANGPLLQATFNGVSSMWYDSNDGTIYLCDPYSQLVRKIGASAPPPLTLSSSAINNNVCNGSNVTVTAVPSNLVSYTFYEGPNVLGTSSNGSIVLTGLSQGNHTITCSGTNSQGQTVNSNSLVLNFLPPLSVSITANGPTTLCPGDSVQLSATNGTSYIWSNGAVTQNIYATGNNTYTVTITDANSCSGISNSLQISELQAPTASITQTPSGPVCTGDTVTLVASSAVSWQWSTGATTQSISIIGNGNYTVLVTNNAGCSAISSPANISYLPQTNASINPSGSILITPGQSVSLSANNGTGYAWSNGATTQNINISNPGTYTVIVTDPNGCLSTPATVNITLQDPATMAIALGSTNICDGDSVEILSSFPTGNQWFRNGIAISGATAQTFYAKQSGAYYLKVIQANGGPDLYSDTINISIIVLPSTITAIEDSACKGQPVYLSITPQSGITYSWYDQPTGGTLLTTGSSFTTPALNGSLTLYIELSDNNGCVKNNRFNITAFQLETPVADFVNNNAQPVSGGFQISFQDASTFADNYFWDFGEPGSSGNTSTISSPSHIYANVGDYLVTLTTTNNSGCSDQILRTISVNRSNNIFIPNAFTPNNDGSNDLFRVRGNNIAYYDLSIFSSWGQRIWFSPKETTGWNGTVNGDLVPNGTYSYVVEVFFEDGNKELYKGNISVIR